MLKRDTGTTSGGWRQNEGKVGYMDQGDLSGSSRSILRLGVRAFIVVMKRGNARGAKGRRKVDVQ